MTEFNPQQQMDLIHSMIAATRKEIRENGLMYLLWGWLVFIASLGNFILLKVGFAYPFVLWLLMPLGGIVSIFLARKESKESKVRTWVDKMMAYIWIAFGVCLAIVLSTSYWLQESTYPMVLMLYGVGTFLSGGALGFRPLILGGIFCWVLAIVSFFIPFEMQLLALALSVLFAYIIPGYILKRRFQHVQ